MRTATLLLGMLLASLRCEALTVDGSARDFYSGLSTQRYFWNRSVGPLVYDPSVNSVSRTQTDERNQSASFAGARDSVVSGEGILLTGSTQINAVHGDPLAGESMCWCLTTSYIRNWSEYWFTVDELSTYTLAWDMLDHAAQPGSTNVVSVILQTWDANPDHRVDVSYSQLGDFDAMGMLRPGAYYLSAMVFTYTDESWQSLPPASSTAANTSFSLSFQTAPAPVPLPASLWLLLSGLSACGLVSRGSAMLAAIAAAMRRWPAAFG